MKHGYRGSLIAIEIAAAAAPQGYTLLDIPTPRQKFVHVHPAVEELGRVYHPHLAINAAPTEFAAALEGLQPPNEIAWREQTRQAHADYVAWTEKATPQPGAVNFGEIIVWLRERVPDAILCNGAGNFTTWAQRFFRFHKFGQHYAPQAGSMGYGLPAAKVKFFWCDLACAIKASIPRPALRTPRTFFGSFFSVTSDCHVCL